MTRKTQILIRPCVWLLLLLAGIGLTDEIVLIHQTSG